MAASVKISDPSKKGTLRSHPLIYKSGSVWGSSLSSSVWSLSLGVSSHVTSCGKSLDRRCFIESASCPTVLRDRTMRHLSLELVAELRLEDFLSQAWKQQAKRSYCHWVCQDSPNYLLSSPVSKGRRFCDSAPFMHLLEDCIDCIALWSLSMYST